MNLQEIKNLMDLIKGTEVVEIEVEGSGLRVRIKRAEPNPPAAEGRAGTGSGGRVPSSLQEREAASQDYSVTTTSGLSTSDKYLSIVSPIVGTFYRSASPDREPYVEVGDIVKKGQIVCIVEAMKLMNEIESEVDGKIAEILVENERPVEYGEPLFRIEPVG